MEIEGVSFFYPNFAYISIKVLHLVLHQHKRDKCSSKIETTAKLIITRTHHHISSGIIEECTYQELSGLLQPYYFSRAKFFVDFYQGTNFGATPAQELETVIQNQNSKEIYK